MRFLWTINLAAAAVIFGGNCFAQPIPSADLIAKAKDYDGKQVVYRGEVVGEVMARGRYAWVNINDGKNAVGIWLEKALTKNLGPGGSYKNRGDMVEVSGIFQRSCKEHGGDLDLHAANLELVKQGGVLKEKIAARRQRLSLYLGAIMTIIWISTILTRPRRKK